MKSDSLILYTVLGCVDLKRSAAFYDRLLATLGYSRSEESTERWLGWGPSYDDGVSFWVTTPFNGAPATAGNGTMIAFRAPDEATVQAFHETALANGGSSEGAPGVRPYYEPSYYVAYVRDPDGNKLACVFHRHQPGDS